MDPFAEGGGLGECAARHLGWQRGEIQQLASGVYGAFGARPEEAVEIRVGEVGENTTRSSVALEQVEAVDHMQRQSVSTWTPEVRRCAPSITSKFKLAPISWLTEMSAMSTSGATVGAHR